MDIASRFIGRDVAVWGRNAVVGNGAFEELYAYDQPLSWPAILPSAAKLDISSSSTADDYSVSKGTVTLTVATPCVLTLNSHGLVSGDAVSITTTGALPTGLTASQVYYAHVLTANTFSLAATIADAVAGTNLIATSGTQSGTHTLFGPGSGANILTVFGLDGNYKILTEDVRLDGQTIVTTTNSFLRVFGAEVIRSGTGLVNAGDIHIVKTGTGGTYTGGVPGTLTSALCKVLAGYGASGNGIFTVPAGKTATLKGLLLTARAQACTFQVACQSFGDPTDNSLHVAFPVEVATNSTSYISASDIGMKVDFKEKTDIRLRVIAAAASGIATGMMILEVN